MVHFNILRKKMVNHGYLEFDRPEAKILVDEKGQPTEIKLREQRTGEKLIENFMIDKWNWVQIHTNNYNINFIIVINNWVWVDPPSRREMGQ